MSEKYSRRHILKMGMKAGAFGLASAGGLMPSILKAKSTINRKKYNVLFIVVDDLRTQLSCYGDKRIISPNFDRLARSGMVFNRAYCQEAVCAPSRISLFTNLRPDNTTIFKI